MATAAVARPAAQALRQRRDPPRLSLGKRANNNASNMADGSDGGPAGKKRKLEEPYVRTNEYILKKHGGKSPSMVVQLHDTHWKFGGQEGSFQYDSPMRLVLQHLYAGTVPHEMLEDLLREGVSWYDGCLIVEVQNHRTAGGKGKQKGRDDVQKCSMHAYNEHITPSPLVAYPQKAGTDEESARAESADAGGDAQQVSGRDKGKGKEREGDGPKIWTTVLHPTELSRHHEIMLLATTPASEMRSGKKKNAADTPSSANPQTPSGNAPPTPVMTSRGPLSANQKMCLEAGDLHSFEGDLLMATEPPLFLDPVDNPQDAQRVLDMLSNSLHSNKAPSPKTRKRTTAEMAADDAQAAEAERRMLIMDERIKPSARGGAGAGTESNQGTAASLGFSRFKTLEMVRQKHEENERVKKEEEARAAQEKKQHDEQNAIRQQHHLQQQQQKQREMLAAQQMQQNQGNTMVQRQALLHAQRAEQQKLAQVQMAAAREHGHPNTNAAMMPQSQQLNNFQMPNNGMGSPVVGHQTPSAMLNSSPMMPNGGFPMVPTSSQGAGSPPRPTTGMQNRNVHMARQASQQLSGSQNNTPQIPQGTPSMASAIPNRQMSQTPRMPPGSPAVAMQGTPTSANGMNMSMPTPQVMQTGNMSGFTPEQQQHMMLQYRNMQNQQQGGHAGSPNTSNLTPDQIQQIQQQTRIRQQQAIMHAQQAGLQAQGQGGQQMTQQQQMIKMQMMQRAQQQAQIRHMQQAQQHQQMAQHQQMNGHAGSPAPGMHPTPTPQMAHAHPQTPQQGMPQSAGGQGQDMNSFQQQQQYAAAQQRAQSIAVQRQDASRQLQTLSQRFGGFNNIPSHVLQGLPQHVQVLARQQVNKAMENQQRQMQQLRAQQQMQQQQGGQGMGADGSVVPATSTDPRYMQQLRQNQAMLQQQLQMQQAAQQQQQQQQQGGGGGGVPGGMGFQMGGSSFGVNAAQQQAAGQGGDALSQHFLNMQNALQQQNRGGQGGGGGGQQQGMQ